VANSIGDKAPVNVLVIRPCRRTQRELIPAVWPSVRSPCAGKEPAGSRAAFTNRHLSEAGGLLTGARCRYDELRRYSARRIEMFRLINADHSSMCASASNWRTNLPRNQSPLAADLRQRSEFCRHIRLQRSSSVNIPSYLPCARNSSLSSRRATVFIGVFLRPRQRLCDCAPGTIPRHRGVPGSLDVCGNLDGVKERW
jgi:hypothetical protein